MERRNADPPIDVARERGGPPVPTKLDKEFGRTITVDPRGGWKEVYCKVGSDGQCKCSPHEGHNTPPISIDDPKCREKIIAAGFENRQLYTSTN